MYVYVRPAVARSAGTLVIAGGSFTRTVNALLSTGGWAGFPSHALTRNSALPYQSAAVRSRAPPSTTAERWSGSDADTTANVRRLWSSRKNWRRSIKLLATVPRFTGEVGGIARMGEGIWSSGENKREETGGPPGRAVDPAPIGS